MFRLNRHSTDCSYNFHNVVKNTTNDDDDDDVHDDDDDNVQYDNYNFCK